jgi:2-iminobutanoate/2-iminopropanoate deaminase
MSGKTIIATDKGPKALGPYSQAVHAGNMLFVSGQCGIDPAVGKIVTGGVQDETRQVFRNIRAILEAAGFGLEHVVQTQVYLMDMADFAAMNAVYAEHFTTDYPARATVQVAGLPAGARVEIMVTAVK